MGESFEFEQAMAENMAEQAVPYRRFLRYNDKRCLAAKADFKERADEVERMDGNRKVIRVVAAVICDNLENKTRIFATARGYGEYQGWWEFPGGKIEPGETPRQALAREIREELTVEIVIGDPLGTIEYDYPAFHLSMDCFFAEVQSGHLELKEAEDARWLAKEELDAVKWLPADRDLLERIRRLW